MQRPFWVEIGLLGVKTRKQAKIWFIVALIAAGLFFAGSFLFLYFLLNLPTISAILIALLCGVFISTAAFWYWLCIRWMDNNQSW
ncbi:MAG: hypothetical protein AB1489_23805 [Acidobacteriota bacterium]